MIDDAPMFGKEIRFLSTIAKMGKYRFIRIPKTYNERDLHEELDKVKPEHIAVTIRPLIDDDGKPI